MKKVATCIVILIVVLGIVLCIANWEGIVNSIGKHIVDYIESKEALPLYGEYMCAELDLDLVFNEQEISVVSSNYKAEVNIDFHGRMLWGEGVVAFYCWDQVNDVVNIRFDQPPLGVSKYPTYSFLPRTADLPQDCEDKTD